jgi:5-hydroxyisourate hydrolase-like protein (transthyretin family)
MQLDRSITGIIRDKEGVPAAGVTVEAVPMRPRQQNDLPIAADSATTDSSGRYDLLHLTTGDYYLGISLSRSPPLQNPYTRWFYPGTEDPTRAAILHVFDRPEIQRFDVMLPAAQHDRVLQGGIFWPDGRPAERVHVFLEDPRWPWQIWTVNATTDKQGRFALHALDGTTYRMHAVLQSNGPVSAELVPIASGSNALDLKLVLTRKGDTTRDNFGKGLENWRKGLGLQ